MIGYDLLIVVIGGINFYIGDVIILIVSMVFEMVKFFSYDGCFYKDNFILEWMVKWI